MNVLMGERYKMATKETKDLLPVSTADGKPFNPEVAEEVLSAIQK